jgi:hypothetical protein
MERNPTNKKPLDADLAGRVHGDNETKEYAGFSRLCERAQS